MAYFYREGLDNLASTLKPVPNEFLLLVEDKPVRRIMFEGRSSAFVRSLMEYFGHAYQNIMPDGAVFVNRTLRNIRYTGDGHPVLHFSYKLDEKTGVMVPKIFGDYSKNNILDWSIVEDGMHVCVGISSALEFLNSADMNSGEIRLSEFAPSLQRFYDSLREPERAVSA